MTKIAVASQEKYDSGPFEFGDGEDGSLDKVIESLAAIRASIPPEYREIAECSIESRTSYEDSSYATIDIAYTRPATPQEISDETDRIAARTREKESADRALYEKLKARFKEPRP